MEDDREWCDAYARAAAREGVNVVRVAKDLAEAETLVDEMKFAVAFVDIGLDIGEDQNIDGLRVMDKIRGTGDETSIVVVTGRSGRDVLPITRDAIMIYSVHDILGKTDIAPHDIRRLLRSGLEAFHERTSTAATASDALRGKLRRWEWDDQMLRAMNVRGGIQTLHEFLDGLLTEFLPVVATRTGESTSVDEATGVAHGNYWSRSVGRAIAICYADMDRAAREIEAAKSYGVLLARYPVAAILKEYSGHGLCGGVFALRDVERNAFGQA